MRRSFDAASADVAAALSIARASGMRRMTADAVIANAELHTKRVRCVHLSVCPPACLDGWPDSCKARFFAIKYHAQF
jgi:hypothetical protein